jgi:dihydroorotate dehydrogenase (fumarate)
MDLSTSMLGFRLAHPFVAGASPLGWDMDAIRHLEDAGCAALVLPSLFEEQVTMAKSGRIRHMDAADPAWDSFLAAFPDQRTFRCGPQEYAEHLARVKRTVSMPVIGSLNGSTGETWLDFSRVIEQAGADALELNVYEVVTDLNVPSSAVDDQIAGTVSELKQALKIPVAVKLSPFFAAFGNVAGRLDRAGADGLVLFNRYYQPDIDIEKMEVLPELQLSTSAELRLRLRWMAILHGRVRPSLVLTGGIATPDDGVKAILAGADAVQVVSALLRHGPGYMSSLRKGLERWMERHEMNAVDHMRGLVSLQHTADPSAFERAHYIRTLQSWSGSK